MKEILYFVVIVAGILLTLVIVPTMLSGWQETVDDRDAVQKSGMGDDTDLGVNMTGYAPLVLMMVVAYLTYSTLSRAGG